MLTVTPSETQVRTEIAKRRKQLHALVVHRNEQVANAQTMIRLANEEFDDLATELNRQIREWEEYLPDDEPKRKPGPVPRAKPDKPERVITVEDGYTPEEVAHFQRLLATSKRK